MTIVDYYVCDRAGDEPRKVKATKHAVPAEVWSSDERIEIEIAPKYAALCDVGLILNGKQGADGFSFLVEMVHRDRGKIGGYLRDGKPKRGAPTVLEVYEVLP